MWRASEELRKVSVKASRSDGSAWLPTRHSVSGMAVAHRGAGRIIFLLPRVDLY